MTLAAVSVLMLAGCGVSKEEHEKVVNELKKTKADLAQALSKSTNLERSLGEVQAQIKSQTKGFADAMSREAQEKLAAAQKQMNDLQAKVKSLTGENDKLKEMLNKLKTEYAEIQKKLGGGVELPAGLPKMP